MKASRVVVWVLTAALAVWCVLTVSVFVGDRFRTFVDSCMYVLTARSLAAGEGYLYQGRPFFIRPPGLAWVLSHVVSDPLDPRALHQVIQWFAAGAFVTIALAMRRLHGATIGAAVALLTATSPLATGGFNKVFSGFPFLLLLFLGAWLVLPDREGRQAGWPRALAGAVVIGVASWVRSVGLLVLPGLVLADLLRRDGRRWQGAALSVVVVLVGLPWTLWAASVKAEAPRPATQLALFDYETAVLRVDKRDPDSPFLDLDGWSARMSSNVSSIVDSLDVLLTGSTEFPLRGLPSALVAAALLFTILHRRSFLDAYVAVLAAIILTYYAFIDRLLLSMAPMIYSSLLYTADVLARRFTPTSADPRTPGVVVAAVAGLLFVTGAVQAPNTMAFDEASANWEEPDHVAAAWVRENTAPDTPVLYMKAPVLAALSGRPVYTYRNLPGTWPEGCPDVDWAIFTPNTSEQDPHERAVRRVAGPPRPIPCDWVVPTKDGGTRTVQAALRLYDLRGD